MNCLGSVQAEAGREDVQTIFAAEGTAAHELGERCLRDLSDADDHLGEEIVVGNHTFEVTEEMADAVQVYLDTIRALVEPGDTLLIEQRFDLSHVWPGMFGTGDAGVYKLATRRLIVIDYKHGKGHAVEVENNPQLAFYGLGMLALPDLAGIKIDDVELMVVQPRSPHRDGPVRSWITDPVALMDFEGDLASAASKTEDPDAPRVAGEWCGFCKAAGTCPALRKVAIEDAQREFVDINPAELGEGEIATLLHKAGLVQDGVRAIQREAYNRAAAGLKIPGYKIVEKRAIRKWKDEGLAVANLVVTLDMDSDDIYSRKLKSPAMIEKLIPKAQRDVLKPFYEAISSGTTLARETDRRAEAKARNSASDDFDPVE
jgi:hypothetical protein